MLYMPSGTKKSTLALLRKRSIKKDGRAHLCGRRGRGSCVQASQGGINHQSAGEALRLLYSRAEHATIIVHRRGHLARVEHDGGASGPGDADAVLNVIDEDLELALLLLLDFERGVEVRPVGQLAAELRRLRSRRRGAARASPGPPAGPAPGRPSSRRRPRPRPRGPRPTPFAAFQRRTPTRPALGRREHVAARRDGAAAPQRARTAPSAAASSNPCARTTPPKSNDKAPPAADRRRAAATALPATSASSLSPEPE